MSTSVLIVDDDPAVRDLLRRFFNAQGIDVSVLHDGGGLRRRLTLERPSIVVLDIMMPDIDGLRALRDLRAAGEDIPVIFVTGCDSVPQKIAGLQSGADDYLAKPFELRELVARVRAVLRRTAAAEPTPSSGQRYAFEGWTLDIGRRSLKRDSGEDQELTTSEFNLLEAFVKRPHRVLSRDEIMDVLKGHDWSPLDRSIDNLIARLRKKIEGDPEHPQLIKTVRGVGYTFAADAKRLT